MEEDCLRNHLQRLLILYTCPFAWTNALLDEMKAALCAIRALHGLEDSHEFQAHLQA